MCQVCVRKGVSAKAEKSLLQELCKDSVEGNIVPETKRYGGLAKNREIQAESNMWSIA